MASEQSSQSHLPQAWPEAAEPSPPWTNDQFGTGPRPPRPEDEPPTGNRSWQTAPGGEGQRAPGPQNDSPGQSATGTDGWARATAPSNDGWAQASNPRTDSWAQAFSPRDDGRTQAGSSDWHQTSPGDGWAQASNPAGPNPSSPGNGWPQTTPQPDGQSTLGADGRPQASGPRDNGWAATPNPQTGADDRHQTSPGPDGWAGATAPQGGNWPQNTQNDSWAQASSPQSGSGDWHQTSPGDGWAQASNPAGPNPSSPGNGWPQTTPQPDGQSTLGADGRPQASGPRDNGWAQATASSNDSWARATAPQDGNWPQNTQGDTRGQQAAASRDVPARPPAENSVWPPAPPAGGEAWPPSSGGGNPAPADAQTSTFSTSWAGPPSEGPAVGAPGDRGGRNDAGSARRSYGVPDNPAMWEAAAAAAASQSAAPSAPQFPAPPHPQAGPQPPRNAPGQPGHHLSRDPSDPNRPFVTAGQISGPKTPPPERQQELWDTVFGDNYQDIDDDLEDRGRPVWIFALAGSVLVALIGAALWAFLAGPLASSEEVADPQPSATATKKASKPAAIGRLPRFTGDSSPVAGTLTDQPAGITLAQLGAPWRQDQRPGMPTTYGFTTRQYLLAGTDSTGKNQYAQLMSGPLSPRLKSRYTSPENLAPVINAVASNGRKRFFPEGNTARKTAQQTLSVNGLPGQLAAYEITSGDSKTTMVVAAVSTGADLPAIVYMSVPDSKKELLPDINTVFTSIRVPGQ